MAGVERGAKPQSSKAPVIPESIVCRAACSSGRKSLKPLSSLGSMVVLFGLDSIDDVVDFMKGTCPPFGNAVFYHVARETGSHDGATVFHFGPDWTGARRSRACRGNA